MANAKPPLDPEFARSELARIETRPGRKISVANVGGHAYYRKDFVEAAERSATIENSEGKRNDELKALKLVPFERLDKPQEYANAGDTMPIVFCSKENNAGGVWISPPLLDSSSDDFDQTFLYLISHGQTSIPITPKNYFLGKQCLADTGVASGLTFGIAHTSDPNVCPISSYPITCTHTNFNVLADPIGTSVGDYTQIRTVNVYATGAVIKVKPLYPAGSSSPTALERYTLTIFRTDNSTGTTTTVGTITTSATGGISSISDSMAAGNYTYTVETTAVATASAIKPETILFEFRQANTFPTSYDRTSSYTDIQLLVAEGNLYDLTKPYSAPADLKQLHIFIEQGLRVTRYRLSPPSISAGSVTGTIGASNIFGDLLYYWTKNSGRFKNQNFAWLSVRDVATCALFNQNYGITFNTYITSSVNFLSYAQSMAPMVLCSLGTFGGSYRLRPLLPLNDAGYIATGTLLPAAVFSDAESSADSVTNTIIAGSYSKNFIDTYNTLPINIVITWRGQDINNLEVTQTVTVRYSDYPADAPEEVHDMSDFCTNVNHAVLFAKYLLATKRYSRHTVTFQTARNITTLFDVLEPLDLIEVNLSKVSSVGDNTTEVEHYLLDSVEIDGIGLTTITATHFPLYVQGNNASIISNEILNGSFVVTV